MSVSVQPKLSVLGQMQEKMRSIAQDRLEQTNERSLKNFVAYLESLQLEWTFEVAVEDEALRSAKLRGKVEAVYEINSLLIAELDRRQGATGAQEGES